MSWRTPCVDDPEKWAGEDWALRRQAAKECLTCPALEWCRKQTEAMIRDGLTVAGVHAGVDYQPTLRRTPRRAMTECEWCGIALVQRQRGANKRYCCENHGYLARREAKAS